MRKALITIAQFLTSTVFVLVVVSGIILALLGTIGILWWGTNQIIPVNSWFGW